MKQRGSAILIAVFLIAAVGSVAFGIGRLFMMESTLANIYESSTIAYYAAESGVEEGFLRYRYNKNTILPVDQSKVSRNDLDASPPTQSNVLLGPFSPVANLRYYTLTMNYLQPYYGADSVPGGGVNGQDLYSSNYPKEYIVPKDESVKIDISEAADRNITFFANFSYDGGTASDAFIEAKLIGETPLGLKEIKAALTPSNPPTSGIFPTGSAVAMSLISGLPETYQLPNIVTEMRNITSMSGFSPIFNNGAKVELYLKPVKCQVKIALVPSSSQIAGPYSTIKSTGYYGGVTRTLEAKIDRQAGTVYDLFDYVLYKKP